MQLEFHQVDAFSDRPFSGNPAMVYRLDAWLADELMQKIAAEHNLAETAFVVREGLGWHIRWFTPTTEVPLCGHATLASAYVLFEIYKEPVERLDFICKSGPLSVSREGGRFWLDFPAIVPSEVGVTLDVERALGVEVVDVLGSNELFVVLESEQAVLDCQPDMVALAKLPWPGAIVTAKGWAPPIPPHPAVTHSRPARSPPSSAKCDRPTWANVSYVPWRMPWVPM